jgi:hypothetical protein
MSVDIFSVGVLNRIVQDLRPMNTFLVDRYFPTEVVEETEEIHFDSVARSRRLAPFVSPLVQGQIVERKGYTTSVFKPAYVKDKRVFDPTAPLKRLAGEQIGGAGISRATRMERLVTQEQQDQQDMLKLRLEVMAAQILVSGTTTISGDNYPTQVVNFGRASGATVVLAGGARWGQAGVDPLADLETWQQSMLTRTGVSTPEIIMDPKAWGLFRATASVTAILNRTREQSTLAPYGQQRNPGDPVSKGNIGGFDIFVYQNSYVDPADNTTKQMIPDYTVFSAAPELEGVQQFGAIRDHESLIAQRSFTKSWLEQDPSVRYLLMQSAITKGQAWTRKESTARARPSCTAKPSPTSNAAPIRTRTRTRRKPSKRARCSTRPRSVSRRTKWTASRARGT